MKGPSPAPVSRDSRGPDQLVLPGIAGTTIFATEISGLVTHPVAERHSASQFRLANRNLDDNVSTYLMGERPQRPDQGGGNP
jgi:hypothetical protein